MSDQNGHGKPDDKRRICGVPRKANGEPCQHPVPCLHHGDHLTEEQRMAHYRRGGLVAALGKLRTLPENTPKPSFDSRESIVTWSEEMARLVGIGAIETKLADSMRGFALLALSAHELAALDRLEKLERVIVKGSRLA